MVLTALGVAVLAVAIGRATPASNGPTASSPLVVGSPTHIKALDLSVPDSAAMPGVVLEVYSPASIRDALAKNAWFREALRAPLGRGFLGSWAAFLDTKGEEINAGFKGPVVDFVVSRLLGGPFRVVWFSGSGAPSSPAVIVPHASAGVRDAVTLFETVAKHGELSASHCPSDQAGPSLPLPISRWLVGDHAMFAGTRGDRLVMARQPESVLAGLCAILDEMQAPQKVDLEVVFRTGELGREATLVTDFLGVGAAARLQFAVEGDRLAPRGLVSDVTKSGRLDGVALTDDMLKLVPSTTGVVMAFQVRLPAKLTVANLKAHLEAPRSRSDLTTRQVVLL